MSRAIQNFMFEYAILHLGQDEIEELRTELAKLTSPVAPSRT